MLKTRANRNLERYAFGKIDSLPKFVWKARNRLIETAAEIGGRFMYKTHLYWLIDQSWQDEFNRQLETSGTKISRDLIDRRFALSQLVKLVKHLEGSTAETGVLQGHGSSIISLQLRDTYRETDHHYAFDSFEGLEEPTGDDKSKLGGHWWKKGDFAEVGEKRAVMALEGFQFARIVKGWIPITFSAVDKDERFRFVHVDVDLFQATKDSIEFFYPRLVQGGLMMFDDYGFVSCPGARKAIGEYFKEKPEELIELPSGQAFIVKQ